ncbi:MAG: hypothetical protein Greene041619_1029 [Candidatus Peregrinibacteria bacterium Greene0416_19]|nr:MAG: hypothetical protein Greene041619_1029 [Candidatus Peregrinibacteria bacterium Greene0416_19]
MPRSHPTDMAPLALKDIPVEGLPVVKDTRELADVYGEKDLKLVRAKLQTNEGKAQLLSQIQEKNPGVKDVEKAADQVNLNTEQLQKKEGFLTRMVKYPFRHPYKTAAGVIGVSAVVAATLFGLNALGFKLPAIIEGALSAVPLEKVKDIITTIFSLGRGTQVLPPGADLGVPGVTV